MATQVQSTTIAQQETALFNTCLELYRKLFPKLEGLGWQEVEACGFTIYTQEIEGVEYVLNMDMVSFLVHVPGQGETPEAKLLHWEILALPEWIELREPVREWEEFRDKYWFA